MEKSRLIVREQGNRIKESFVFRVRSQQLEVQGICKLNSHDIRKENHLASQRELVEGFRERKKLRGIRLRKILSKMNQEKKKRKKNEKIFGKKGKIGCSWNLQNCHMSSGLGPRYLSEQTATPRFKNIALSCHKVGFDHPRSFRFPKLRFKV